MRKKYLKQCKVIKENCNYNAETHHIIAKDNKKLAIKFQIIPAVVAAILGSLVAGQIVPLWIGWMAVIAAVVAAVGNVLNPNKEYYDNLLAAKMFTSLKQEVGAFCNAFASRMSDDKFFSEVENLQKRYNDIIKVVPPTNDKAFEKARDRIKLGVHE